MRRLLFAAAAILAVAVSTACAQTSDDARSVVRDVTEAMVGGNPDVLLRVAGSQVEVSVDGQSSVYTKAQARYVTGAFLDQHPVREARVREVNVVGRQCTARSRLIGADKSEVWDLFLRMRRARQGWELKEIRLTPAPPNSRSG